MSINNNNNNNDDDDDDDDGGDDLFKLHSKCEKMKNIRSQV